MTPEMELVGDENNVKTFESTGVVLQDSSRSSPKLNEVGVRALPPAQTQDPGGRKVPHPWRNSLVHLVVGGKGLFAPLCNGYIWQAEGNE